MNAVVAPGSERLVDIAIIGGGPVGLALAGWLAARGRTRALKLAVIDARDPQAASADPRFLAISHASRALLETLPGFVWPSTATPIHRIHISRQGQFGRALIDRREHGLPELGAVVRYGALLTALQLALTDSAAPRSTSDVLPALRRERGEVSGIETLADGVAVSFADQRTPLTASLVISAEGGVFATPRNADGVAPTTAATATATATADVDTRSVNTSESPARPAHRSLLPASRDYRQTAIVGSLQASGAPPHLAWERFTREGPVALLPAGAGRFALVWCCSAESAARRLRLDEPLFLAELNQVFGGRLGSLAQLSGRAAYPLGLLTRTSMQSARVAAIGNSAQTLHPVAGQGLNLGLRDAYALCAALSEFGAVPAALAAFAARRQVDRALTVGLTDLLARGFTSEFAPIAAVRGATLAALDLLAPAKSMLARQMMFGQRG
ncbi:MAG: UbiH/UbiF/VisC/COQ6 family ubiquinone biosynthesis hydroxylase [Janthinobacterium lividum]